MAAATKPKPKKKFSRLNKRERAVAVAKDVLKHLEAMHVTPGTYFVGEANIEVSRSTNPQEFVDVIQKKCDVCAIGACVISHIRLFDKVRLNEVIDPFDFSDLPLEDTKNTDVKLRMSPSNIRSQLAKHFRKKDIYLIECAFERDYSFYADKGDEKVSLTTRLKEARAAEKFGRQHRNARKRLAAIMRNIIRNKGHFVVPQKFYK